MGVERLVTQGIFLQIDFGSVPQSCIFNEG